VQPWSSCSEGDSEIQQEVMRELESESHVRAPDIGVTAHGGVVTEKHAAQEAAHVAGDQAVVAPNRPTRKSRKPCARRSPGQREDAESAVRGLRGIRGIENHIVVEPLRTA
jgi:osmotically-inducible protein OsmY